MNQAIVYAVVAMACYGVGDFIYKRAAAAGIRADHFLMVQAWFFCPSVILYALVTHTLVPDPAAVWGSLAGAFVFIGFYFFFLHYLHYRNRGSGLQYFRQFAVVIRRKMQYHHVGYS